MNNKFLGYAEVGKVAEKVWKIGRKTGDFRFVDADEVGLNLHTDILHNVSTEWSMADTPKYLMIKVDAPAGYMVGRIYVRKASQSEIKEYLGE